MKKHYNNNDQRDYNQRSDYNQRDDSDRSQNRSDNYNRRGGRGGGRGGYGRGGHRNYDRNSDREYNQAEDLKQCSDQYDYARNIVDDTLVQLDNIFISKDIVDDKKDRFEAMDLKENLLKGIYAYGFDEPSVIQTYMIPQIIKKRDCLAQSKSGTGKTGAFTISALQLIDETQNVPQAIILSPTFELAQQTFNVATELSKKMDIRISFTAGGTERQRNLQELGSKNPEYFMKGMKVAQLVIATPGRLLDIMDQEPEIFANIKLFIVDECDALLTGEFKKDMKNILYTLDKAVKPEVPMQVCLFSATLDQEKVEIANKILNNAVKVLIIKEHMTLDQIEQTYIIVNDDDEKFEYLLDFLARMPVEQFLVYVNSKRKAEWLQDKLLEKDIDAMCINGDQQKSVRSDIVKKFRSGNAKCLISTDILSRGIDIQQLSFVLNFDIPNRDNIPSYLHRIGRSGRHLRRGLAINLVNDNEYHNILNRIQLTFNCKIRPLESDYSNYCK